MKLKYSLEDRPKLLPLLMYGLQWLLIAVPVVLTSTFIARLQYDSPAEQTLYTQKLFAVMGSTIIAQVLWGHRLPLIAGPAAVLIIGILASTGASPDVLYTSVAVGGGLLAIAAASGWLGRIQPLFTPRIVIVILALIAFTITPVFLGLIFDDGERPLFSFCFAIVTAIAMAVANNMLRGVWKSTVVLLALIVGSAVYYAAAGLPESAEMTTGAGGAMLNWPLKFDAGVIIAFMFCYIALLINELGSIQSTAAFVEADRTARRSTRGTAVTGIMNVIAGLCGVIGPVDYSLSPGVIAATGCASRYTLLPAGIGLILCALFPDLVAILSAIPSTVMGTVLMYLMAAQLAAAFQMSEANRSATDFNGALTLGLPIMVALVVAFAPASVGEHIPSLLRPILGNGFVMGVITVLLLEHVVFRRRKL